MATKKGSNDAPGMRGDRARNKGGQLREKRGDTRADTIEEKYNIDTRMRGDAHLDTVLERHGVKSLHDLVEKLRK